MPHKSLRPPDRANVSKRLGQPKAGIDSRVFFAVKEYGSRENWRILKLIEPPLRQQSLHHSLW